ncbi:MAG: hypothetical protein DMG39_17160 [Acidobacteria bacterium]|nr:MAG: hypothetical protein DMG39_17160 [Acidobacteriota bacterium]
MKVQKCKKEELTHGATEKKFLRISARSTSALPRISRQRIVFNSCRSTSPKSSSQFVEGILLRRRVRSGLPQPPLYQPAGFRKHIVLPLHKIRRTRFDQACEFAQPVGAGSSG